MANAAVHPRTLRLGTRGSQLARWQADWVAGELRKFGHAIELIEIATHGDVDRARSIEQIGTQGVFTRAIQHALLSDDVDLAVHSLKDLPTDPVVGLVLAAVPQRESPADVLVGARGASSEERRVSGLPAQRDAHSSLLAPHLSLLPPAARIGTGSLRRQAQLRHSRPDLLITEVRGNVDTRLRKLDEGQFDAIVLAEAGLRRLGLQDRIRHVLPFDVMLPAVGQGALGIECRADDDATRTALSLLNDAATQAAVSAERALLHHLRGGCMAPVGALGLPEGSHLRLQAVVLSADGARRLAASDSAPSDGAETLGRRVAESLIKQGAAELIAETRQS
jgi:hydroxymethylbilane synthase